MKTNLDRIETKLAPKLNGLANRLFEALPKKVPFDWRYSIRRFVDTTVVQKLAALESVFKTRQLESFPAGSNPFHHDMSRQGMAFYQDDSVMIMWNSDPTKGIVIYHKASGQRLEVEFKDVPAPVVEVEGWIIDQGQYYRWHSENNHLREYEYLDARAEFLAKWGYKK